MDAPVFFFVKEVGKADATVRNALRSALYCSMIDSINCFTLTPEQAEPFYKRNRSA